MDSELLISSQVVSVEWLHKHLNHPNLVLLDTTIPKVTSNESDSNETQIPSARFFDLKKKFSDVSAPFPATFPSETQFESEAQNLGINKNSAIVVYDDKGIYSSPRVWWLFKAFGFNNMAVLDGGFPAWKNAGYKMETKHHFKNKEGDFQAALQPEFMKFFDDIKRESQNASHLIVDARSEKRFNGLVPEPRKGLRSGTIPNSVNLPYENLLDENCFKSIDELKQIFNTFINQDSNITLSCGSGITACVLALGAELAGLKNISVYDGSWTEWGTLIKE